MKEKLSSGGAKPTERYGLVHVRLIRYIAHSASDIFTWVVFSVVVVWAADIGARTGSVDYWTYWRAGQHELNVITQDPWGIQSFWLYADFLWPAFIVFRVVTRSLWFYVQVAAYAGIILKLRKETPNAWAFVFATTVPFFTVLECGNMGCLLAFTSATPIGAALGCIFKPYLILFVVLFLARRAMDIHKAAKAHR